MIIYLRILRFVKPYWKRVIGSFICTLFYSVFSGISIYLFIPLLDLLFHPEKISAGSSTDLNVPGGISTVIQAVKQAVVGYIFHGTQMEALFKVCVIILIAFLLKNFFGYMQSFFMNYVEEGIIKDIRNELYRHLHDLP